MTHESDAQVLHYLREQLKVAEPELAALQSRVNGLRVAIEGMEEAVRPERDVPSEAPPDASPAPSAPPSPAPSAPPSPALPAKPPSTGAGALLIIRGDTSRSWNPRQIWEEEVQRKWVANTSEGRSAVRIALKRLAAKYPHQIERVPDGMTFAYRWRDDTNGNGHPALPGATAWHMPPTGRTDS
jgi:hypothetical protein